MSRSYAPRRNGSLENKSGSFGKRKMKKRCVVCQVPRTDGSPKPLCPGCMRLSERDRALLHNKNSRLRFATFKALGLQKEFSDRQSGHCAICDEIKPLVVDHDHFTDLVRGMLCTGCNNILGGARDNPDNLIGRSGPRADIYERASDYLKTGGFV